MSNDGTGWRVRGQLIDDAMFVHLGDVIAYVEGHPWLKGKAATTVREVLHQLGEALESDA